MINVIFCLIWRIIHQIQLYLLCLKMNQASIGQNNQRLKDPNKVNA